MRFLLAAVLGIVASTTTASAGTKVPRVLVSADESQIAFGTTICPADTVDLTRCRRDVGADALDGFAAVKLKATHKRRGRVGALRLRLDRNGDLEVRLGRRTLDSVHVHTSTLVAAGVTPGGNVVVALRDGRAVLVLDHGWLHHATDTDSYSWRVLVSADESELAIETSGQSVMYGQQIVHRICPASSPDHGSCETYAAVVPEGGSEADAQKRYDTAIAAGGFRRVRLAETSDRRGTLGKLRVRIHGGTLEVRRGKRLVGSLAVSDDRPTIAGIGLTPGGKLVAVIDGWYAVMVPLTGR
jgi:hypothetical protein